MSERKTVKVTTPEFRVSFPNVFKAKSFNGSEESYSLCMLFPKSTDLTPIKKAIQEVIDATWPDKSKRTKLWIPLRDGDAEKGEREEYQGCVFANAKSKRKPGVVDAQLNLITSDEEFYGGCYARATIVVYPFEKSGNKGVAFGLNNLQKSRDGERFSGRNSAENDFEALETENVKVSTGDFDF